jgi:PilZ domain-containing protein
VLAHDSDYSRVVPRAATIGAAAASAPSPLSAAAAKPVAPALAASAAGVADADTATSAAGSPALDHGTRRAPRFKIASNIDVLIDGNPAALVELSSVGAQVVSPTILKPNQRVRMVLTDEGSTIRVSASVAWAAFEIPTGGPQYRAGIEFLDADAAAIDSFCQRHV